MDQYSDRREFADWVSKARQAPPLLFSLPEAGLFVFAFAIFTLFVPQLHDLRPLRGRPHCSGAERPQNGELSCAADANSWAERRSTPTISRPRRQFEQRQLE